MSERRAGVDRRRGGRGKVGVAGAARRGDANEWQGRDVVVGRERGEGARSSGRKLGRQAGRCASGRRRTWGRR